MEFGRRPRLRGQLDCQPHELIECADQRNPVSAIQLHRHHPFRRRRRFL